MNSLRMVIALLLTVTVSLRAQDARLLDRFPSPLSARLGAIVDSAAREGLPGEPLILRALEGQAKGASTTQIVDALGRLREALRNARSILGSNAAPGELITGAAALQADVPPARLADLHRLRGSMSVTAPLSAYLDLVAHGAQADRAWDRVSDLARHRAKDAEFSRLTPAGVDRDAARVHPPAGAAPGAPQ